LRQPAGDFIADAALVIRIGETVQEPDCHRLYLLAGDEIDCPGKARRIQRHQHSSLRIDPLANGHAEAARNQRWRQVDVYIVLLETILVADLEDVAKAFGGQQRRLGALALDQRIRGQRGAVDDEVHLSRLDARSRDHAAYSIKPAGLGRAGRGERLCRETALAHFERHVSERAADVDPQPDLRYVVYVFERHLKPFSENRSRSPFPPAARSADKGARIPVPPAPRGAGRPRGAGQVQPR
jgi:hypothetical protein